MDVPCEDLAACNGIGIWPYDLDIDETIYADLIEALRDWVKKQNLDYRLYITRGKFESNMAET